MNTTNTNNSRVAIEDIKDTSAQMQAAVAFYLELLDEVGGAHDIVQDVSPDGSGIALSFNLDNGMAVILTFIPGEISAFGDVEHLDGERYTVWATWTDYDEDEIESVLLNCYDDEGIAQCLEWEHNLVPEWKKR